MVSVMLYVEGGGEHAREFRRGLGMFIERAGAAGKMPRIVICGRRDNAFDKFRTAHEYGEDAMLLVDAEEPVTAVGPWEHLKGRDYWNQPVGAKDAQCHLMVQVMESWFLADVDALESYYGQGFRRQALPRNPKIEDVSKLDVNNGLDQATRDSQKGPYSKGKHSFEILERLDPTKVMEASPYAKRLIEAITS